MNLSKFAAQQSGKMLKNQSLKTHSKLKLPVSVKLKF
jgi:hypothetical protein